MQPIGTMLVKLAAAGSLALISLGTTGCFGEVYGDPAYYPSDGIVATEDPVYYDGQATYFYDGRWYYRDGANWSYYRSEPGYLRQYRTAHPGVMHGGVRGGRGAVRGGGAHGGSRGGGGHGGRR
jgi:hypothetical protein